jgi:hypothetical protein
VRGAFRSIDLSLGELRIEFPEADLAVTQFPATLLGVYANGAMRTEDREVESRMQRIDGDWQFAAFDFRAANADARVSRP